MPPGPSPLPGSRLPTSALKSHLTDTALEAGTNEVVALVTADGLGEGDSHRHCHQGEQIHRLLVGPWPDLGRGLGAGWEDLGKQLETLSTNQSYLATVPFCSSVSGSPVPHGREQRSKGDKKGRKGGRERRASNGPAPG